MKRSSRRAGVVLCIISISTPLGCGGSGQGFATPEACYQAVKKAVEAKDWGGFYDCLTPESQEIVAGSMVLMGSMMKMMSGMAALGGPEAAAKAEKETADLTAVLEKHGVTDTALEGFTPDPATMQQPEAIKKLADVVKDKRGFVVDMFAAMEKTATGGPNFDKKLAGELKDVKIDGDKATAKVAGAEGEQELDFLKTADGWKLHIDLNKIKSDAGPGPAIGPEAEPLDGFEDVDGNLTPPEGLDLNGGEIPSAATEPAADASK